MYYATTDKKHVEEELKAALEEMGHSHRLVALFLKREKIKGSRHDPDRNPISNYLYLRRGIKVAITDDDEPPSRFYSTPLPKPVVDFLELFDRGKYWELEWQAS